MGHAGELVQGALRLEGQQEPFLVTLPAPCLRSTATVIPSSAWSVRPAWRSKALRAAQLAARDWDWPNAASVEIQSSIPVARGFGSSTADCVAAVRALADLIGHRCADTESARIVQQAEGASDSTMFELTPVVFLPERGECRQRFTEPWPAVHVTAFDLGGPDVHTESCTRPEYSDAELDEFGDILEQLEQAFRTADAALLAACSTRSAGIHQRYHPHPHWQDLQRLVRSTGAYGLALSHSGVAAALLSGKPVFVGECDVVDERLTLLNISRWCTDLRVHHRWPSSPG